MSDIELPIGYEAVFLASVGSTNTEAFARELPLDAKGLWVVADEQLEGRGSRGRSWISEPGNLYASLLIHQPSSAKNVYGLTFLAAVALRETLTAFVPSHSKVQVKWPNDILVNGKKVAGLLLEAQSYSGGTRLVMGMGTNVLYHPSQAEFPATSLLKEGAETSLGKVFELLAKTIAKYISLWEDGAGLSSILALWRLHAWGLGSAVSVKLPTGQIYEGLFEALEADGRMRLKDLQGKRHLFSVAQIMRGPDGPATA